MTPIIRNLISVVRRFKLAASLNILGLSVAFAAFMVIMIQLDYDYSFDKCHQEYDKIFRLEIAWETSWQAYICLPFAERFFESSPHIVAGAIASPWSRKNFFHVENDGVRNFFEEHITSVSPEFTDVFTFEIVEGRENALKIPGNVIIPLTLSHKLFGNEPAVGKQLVYDWGSQTIGAVYRDFPANTVVNNCIYMPITDQEYEERRNWGQWNYQVFIRVHHPSNVPLLMDNFKRNFNVEGPSAPKFNSVESDADLRLTALPDIHFITDVRGDETPKASRQTLLIFFAIAVVIIVIAGINFTNFTTALSPMRMKNINTQRVLGLQQRTIRWLIVSEAVFFSLSSYLVSLFFIKLLQITPLTGLVDVDLSLAAHPAIVGCTALVALFTGFLAGVYPARYMTSFASALVLKGSFGLSPKGKKMRNTLIGIQYAASFALIIGASFMYLQNHYMQHSPLGYDNDALITVDVRRIQKSRDAFTNQIKTYAGIEDVTYSTVLLSSARADGYDRWGISYRGEIIWIRAIPAHYSFLDAMGIEITKGRSFRQEDEHTSHGAWVFNESARRQFNLEINSSFAEWPGGEIIGFIHDIKYASFHTAVEPMGFFVPGTVNRRNTANFAYIKLNPAASMRAAMSHIHSTLAEFDAGYPFEVRFFDEVLQRLYEKETALSSLISLFSMIAIFISIVGVFGLVVFDSECRRKEIGIRKVLGASTMGIIIMFNKAYFKILVICFVIAAPLAWYAVTRWLENFAYKTPMYWWVYLLAFIGVAVITAGTVTFQNWRVANDDPVKAIKSE